MINRINQGQLNKEFDLVVIGGGINGCGIARDASERGLKVLLLEKEDFGAGCTSASTRLIHGGLRYLEHLEFDLVRESLRERELLLKHASHLVRPLELCIPIYKGDRRGYWLIKTGMVLYDFLSFDKTLPPHKMLSASDFSEYEPGVKNNNLIGAAVYFDSQALFPERICLENVLMAKQAGALTINHTEVISIKVNSSKISEIEFLDCLSNIRYKVRGKIVVNASGPWVDSLCGLIKSDFKKLIGGTKGSHIIVKKFENGPKHAIYANAKSDGRPFFIIPWQENYLIGTTDIFYSRDLNFVKADANEIKYLLQEANNLLSKSQISYNDILFTYSGVRPLPYTENLDPSKITRRHIVLDHAYSTEQIENFISVIGGKLTTYRNLSEIVVNLVFKKLKNDFVNFTKSKTKIKPLLGNVNGSLNAYKAKQLKKIQKEFDIEPEIVFHLIDLYGTQYKHLIDILAEDFNHGRLLSSNALDIRAQVVFGIKNEMAFTLSDILLRRTSLGLNKGLGQDAIPEVIKQLQLHLNLSQVEIDKQINDYNEHVVKLRKIL